MLIKEDGMLEILVAIVGKKYTTTKHLTNKLWHNKQIFPKWKQLQQQLNG